MIRFKRNSVIKMAIMAILIILCYSCIQKSDYNRRESEIKAIKLFFKWQLIATDDFKLINIVDSINIYYYRNMVLYQIGHPYDVRKIKLDTNGSISSGNVIQEGIRYSYFVYKKNELYGFKYDSINAQTPHRFLVDSFLKAKLSLKEEMFVKSNDSLIETKRDKRNNLYEKYIPKVKYDETYADSSYYYYNGKMNGIDYSFSKKKDQEKNMKLCKIIFVYNPSRSSKYPRELPRREFRFEIEEMPIADSKEILAFLKGI